MDSSSLNDVCRRLCNERIRELNLNDFTNLVDLQQKYKASIGEPLLTDSQTNSLKDAVLTNKIEFFCCEGWQQSCRHVFGKFSVSHLPM